MREPAKSFQDLIVWTGGINAWGNPRRHALQKANEFVLAAYRFSGNFPKSETYGLVSQFRSSAVSIAANIAEGFKKKGKADKLRFFNISQGSLEECRYYLILSKDLNYGDTSTSFAST